MVVAVFVPGLCLYCIFLFALLVKTQAFKRSDTLTMQRQWHADFPGTQTSINRKRNQVVRRHQGFPRSGGPHTILGNMTNRMCARFSEVAWSLHRKPASFTNQRACVGLVYAMATSNGVRAALRQGLHIIMRMRIGISIKPKNKIIMIIMEIGE